MVGIIADEAAQKSSLPRWSIPFFIPGMKLIAYLKHGINLGSLKPELAIKELSYAVLLIHGEADRRIPVSQSQRLAAAPAGSELWLVSASEHANGFAHQPEEYTAKVASYFMERLKQEKSCGL